MPKFLSVNARCCIVCENVVIEEILILVSRRVELCGKFDQTLQKCGQLSRLTGYGHVVKLVSPYFIY